MSYVYVDPSHYSDVFEEPALVPVHSAILVVMTVMKYLIGAAGARAGLHGHFRADGALPARNLVTLLSDRSRLIRRVHPIYFSTIPRLSRSLF